MALRATFLVRSEPFFIAGRGVASIGDLVEGDLRLGALVTASIPGGPGGLPLAHEAGVEAAQHVDPDGSRRDRPALLFRAERGSESAELLRGLLRPGTLLILTGPGVA